MLRLLFVLIAVAVAACEGVESQRSIDKPASIPPPPPPLGEWRLQRWELEAAEIRKSVEAKVLERLGAEALRQGTAADPAIMLLGYDGRFGSAGPVVNVVGRSGLGWFGWKSGRSAPLPLAAGAEIERVLQDSALWRETPFWPDMDCPDAGALMMVIRHQDRIRITRQACGTNGLTGRLFATVAQEAIPSEGIRY
jgi:hypothetical protein